MILIDLYIQSSQPNLIKDPIDGPFFIERIRQSVLYTPIVFHSKGRADRSGPVERQLQDSIEDRKIWKVNLITCEKETLDDFLPELLSVIHNEESRISAVRGALIEYISEMDDLISEAIDKLLRTLSEKDRKRVLDEFRRWVAYSERKANRPEAKTDDEKFQNFIWAISDGPTFTLTSRVVILEQILKVCGEKHLANEFEFFRNGNRAKGLRPLMEIRNIYAHKTADVINSPDYADARDFKRIRIECRRHLKNINGILAKYCDEGRKR